MNSQQKVAAALDHVEGFADDQEAETAVRAMAGMVIMGRAYVEQLLPRDPAELDSMLEKGAHFFASLRSDDAPPLVVGADTPVL